MRFAIAALVAGCVGAAPAAPEPAELPEPPQEAADLINQGVKRLIETQEPDGAWTYQGVVGKPPGYRVGGTAFVCMALMTAPFASKDSKKSIDRGLEFIARGLAEDGMAATFDGTYDTRGWGHIYALELYARRKMKKEAAAMIDALARTEIEQGGWNYARGRKPFPPSSFMTASALLALRAAKDAGNDVPQAMVDRALAVLKASRAKEAAYAYSVRDKTPMDLPPGSIARGPQVEVALARWGQAGPETMRASVEMFFQHWDELEKRRKKTGTHAGKYGIAPYYFYYGHLYVAQAIELSPEALRPDYRRKLLDLLVKTRDGDGTWNDRVFEVSRAYGTAMSILALQAPRTK